MAFNQQEHFERKPDEVWITNGEFTIGSDYKTLRRGHQALDSKGKVIPEHQGLYPWFITKKEYDEWVAECAKKKI